MKKLLIVMISMGLVLGASAQKVVVAAVVHVVTYIPPGPVFLLELA
jgi:hypothetical protein